MLELNTCSWLTCIEYFIYQKMHRCKYNQQDSNSEESLSNALLSYPHGFYFLKKEKENVMFSWLIERTSKPKHVTNLHWSVFKVSGSFVLQSKMFKWDF